MNCENHADREGTLTVDLPSIGVRRFMCAECRSAFNATMSSAPSRFARDGKDPFGLMTPYNPYYQDMDCSGGRLYGPSSREERHKENLLDRSDE